MHDEIRAAVYEKIARLRQQANTLERMLNDDRNGHVNSGSRHGEPWTPEELQDIRDRAVHGFSPQDQRDLSAKWGRTAKAIRGRYDLMRTKGDL